MITGVQPKLLVGFDDEGNMTLDAFDKLTELFVNDKVTIQCGKGNYYVVIEFSK